MIVLVKGREKEPKESAGTRRRRMKTIGKANALANAVGAASGSLSIDGINFQKYMQKILAQLRAQGKLP